MTQPETGPRTNGEIESELMSGAEPDERLDLVFRDIENVVHVDDELERDLSALAVSESTLFCACDETSTVERLLYDP